jgi:hypothetical protein
MHRSGCRRGPAAAGVSLFSERDFHPAAGARPKILRTGGDTETLYVCMYLCMYVCISLAEAESVYYMLKCKCGEVVELWYDGWQRLMYICMYVCTTVRTLTELGISVCMYVCIYVCMLSDYGWRHESSRGALPEPSYRHFRAGYRHDGSIQVSVDIYLLCFYLTTVVFCMVCMYVWLSG